MDVGYLITPFVTWFICGILKFLINSIKAGKLAFGLIGYGGMPSNHSAIVSSMATLIAFREGIAHPAFGVALTLAFIVMMDANSLRIAVGKHARVINQLAISQPDYKALRERMGHTKVEILSGILVGVLVSYGVYFLSTYFSNMA